MASRTWQLGIFVVGALALGLGCLGPEGGPTTVGNEGVGTDDGFDEGFDSFDEGQEGGLFGECLGYLQACQEDPYCACYMQCAIDYESTYGCLERCQLATTPYWAEQLINCFAGELGGIVGIEPDPIPGDGDGDFDTLGE